MPCPRCGGLVIVEAFNDLGEEGSRMWFQGDRCLNCGGIEDSVIRANRLDPPAARRSRPAGAIGKGGPVWARTKPQMAQSAAKEIIQRQRTERSA